MLITLFRSNNIFDSRVNKYVNYYRRAGLEYTIVGWDRANEGLAKEKYEFFRYPAGVAVGGVKAIKNHSHWMKFVYEYLRQHPEITTVHACDLNSAFPAACFKKFVNPKLTLIFDACDWYSAQYASKKLLQKVFVQMEKFTCKWADHLIICEPERRAQITFALRQEPLVMPNIPEIDESLLAGEDSKYEFDNDWPTLAYLGVFTNDRFLVELLESAKTERVNILIGGNGSEEVMMKLKELQSFSNVKYFGRMPMAEGLLMSKHADAIYAMYCKTNANHIFAAPNKYYEAMLLGKPFITTKGTILEEKVVKNGIGYVIDENMDELIALERSLTKEDMKSKGMAARHLWDTQFKNFIPKFFDDVYSTIIK